MVPKGRLHLAVYVCLFDGDGRMLIQQRQMDKRAWPGYWDITAGGAALRGETSARAAMREAEEEMGITIDLAGQQPALSFSMGDCFTDVYLAAWPVEAEVRVQASEVQAARWATREDIHRMIDRGTFISWPHGLIDLLFEMRRRGGQMAGGVRFRPARAEDALTLARLRRRLWALTYRGIYPDGMIDGYDEAYYAAQDAQRIQAAGSHVFLLEDGGEPVGYLHDTAAEGRVALRSLYLLPAYRRRGLGRQAMARVAEACQNQGAPGFTLQCHPRNEAAMAFYRHMGGQMIRMETGHENPAEDAAWFHFDADRLDGMDG